MTERVLLLLAQPSVVEALQSDDAVETISEISPLSDHYIPMLQFLMRPDNLVALVFCMLEAPPADPARKERHEAAEPTYDEYAIVFRAHWVLCSSGFSSQLISALLALQPQPGGNDMYYRSICERLVTYYSHDAMNLEALTRFLNLFMDQYSPETLIGFFGPTYDLRFMQCLLVLIHYEPVRDVLLRLCNEIPDTYSSLRELTTQLLCQLAPERECRSFHHVETFLDCIKADPAHIQFARMIFTCDLLTDLIHEKRHATLGHYIIRELNSSETHIAQLLDATMRDLEALPTPLANESYAIKVLNSLLQQSQCGCVSKIAFAAAFSRQSEASGELPVDDTQLSPHVDLPMIWKRFIVRLPEFLRILRIPPLHRYRTSHVQMIYLMLPILNVSCAAVDRELIKYKTMEGLLELITRFPQANILHCAISRLFIVALEDSPFMFGKELPAFRAANDPLRLHMLLSGCFESVVDAYDTDNSRLAPCDGRKNNPPPAFVDIAISFDQAVTNAHAHSPHLFPRGMMQRWQAFRSQVLLPTQTQWEEQQGQLAPSSPINIQAFMDGVNELYDPSDGIMIKPSHEAATPPSARSDEDEAQPLDMAGLSSLPDEIPTPLSALYNEEEKKIMLRVGTTAENGRTVSASRTASFKGAFPVSTASS